MSNLHNSCARFKRQSHLIEGITLFFFLASSMTNPILPLFIVSVGASKFQLGLITAIPSIVSIIIRIPMGVLSDRVGRWPMLPISMLGTSISFIIQSLASRIVWFYPVRILSAISQVSFLPTLHAIASELAPMGKRGETVGRYLSMMGLSMMLGPFLGSFLIKYTDYRLMFLFAAIFPTFGLIVFMIARSYGLTGSTHHKKEVVEKVGYQKSRSRIPKERKRFTKIIKSGSIAVTCFAGFLFAVSIGTFSTLFSVHAEEVLFFTPTIISLLFSVRGAANALIRFPAGRIADKIGRKKPLLMGICLMFATFIILSLSQSFFILFIIMCLYGLGWGMRAVSSITLIGESVSLERRGVAMALYLLMIDLGIAVGSIIAGAAASIFSTQTIFQITALIALPSIPVVAMAKSIK